MHLLVPGTRLFHHHMEHGVKTACTLPREGGKKATFVQFPCFERSDDEITNRYLETRDDFNDHNKCAY